MDDGNGDDGSEILDFKFVTLATLSHQPHLQCHNATTHVPQCPQCPHSGLHSTSIHSSRRHSILPLLCALLRDALLSQIGWILGGFDIMHIGLKKIALWIADSA